MGQGEKPRCHSHPLRAQEHIITSDSMLFAHDSSKIVEPSMIVDLHEMERNMLKEGEEMKLKISGGMENIQVRATSHTPGCSTNVPVESFSCTSSLPAAWP